MCFGDILRTNILERFFALWDNLPPQIQVDVRIHYLDELIYTDNFDQC